MGRRGHTELFGTSAILLLTLAQAQRRDDVVTSALSSCKIDSTWCQADKTDIPGQLDFCNTHILQMFFVCLSTEIYFTYSGLSLSR